jgi:hypothetical protein
MAIAHEVGLKPPRQAMFAARCGQSIDDQHQSAITQCRGLATGGFGELVERCFEAELTPQVARHQHWSPIPRRDRADVLPADAAVGDRLAVQQAHQFVEVEMCRQQILAPEIVLPCRNARPQAHTHE